MKSPVINSIVCLLLANYTAKIAALVCYNGCGLRSEKSDFCTENANAYLAVNDYSEGKLEKCPESSTQCGNVLIWDTVSWRTFTIKGCDTEASCQAKLDIWNKKYVMPGVGEIKWTGCCNTDECNGAGLLQNHLLVTIFPLVIAAASQFTFYT